MAGEKKVTYVTLAADPALDPSYEAALRTVEQKYLGRSTRCTSAVKSLTGEEFEDRSPIDTSNFCWKVSESKEGACEEGNRCCG
jgi:hypothetical protein